jgi:uncharacterized coiled-coil DUF342 family protein
MNDLLENFTSEIIGGLCANPNLPNDFLVPTLTIIQNKLREYSQEISVYKVTSFGTSYTTDNFKDLIEHLKENFEHVSEEFSPKIETVNMTKAEYKSLPEFQGY